MNVLRLRCECGRNLADVTKPTGNPDFTRDGLAVYARPNVDQQQHRQSGEAQDVSYTWRCRCGDTHTRRHDRITELWQRHATEPRHAVYAVLGVDL